jgi:hypothetical protein
MYVDLHRVPPSPVANNLEELATNQVDMSTGDSTAPAAGAPAGSGSPAQLDPPSVVTKTSRCPSETVS